MNYPQDAIKDRFEHDPEFCYDCCAPLDECVCEGNPTDYGDGSPDLSGNADSAQPQPRKQLTDRHPFA